MIKRSKKGSEAAIMAEFKPIFPCDQKLPCAANRNDEKLIGCGHQCYMTSDITHRADGVIYDTEKGRIVPYFINEGANNER